MAVPLPINLTPAEIREITGAVRKPTQAKRLREMGFIVRVRCDGYPLVTRDHYLAVMSGGVPRNRHRPPTEPDFGALL